MKVITRKVLINTVQINGVHSSAGLRALGCGPKSREFESRCSPYFTCVKMKTKNQFQYKTLLRLRCNPQSRKKVLTFKKLKWEKFVKSLIRSKKLDRLLYDQFVYYKSPKLTVLKSKGNYRTRLIARQRFKLRFGNLTEKTLNRSHTKNRPTGSKKSLVLNSHLLNSFERRLDNILCNVGFTRSIRSSRQLIFKNAFSVNGININQPSYRVKPGDLIYVKPNMHPVIAENLSSSFNKQMAYKHLHINYRTFELYVGPKMFSCNDQYNYFLGVKYPLKI